LQDKTLFKPGQEVGDYLIKRKLDEGGMAELYLAVDVPLKRTVVIKALTDPYCKKKAFRKQFVREARIQAKLDSPHIVQIFRAFDYESTPCLVMQHVRGTDLDRVIKRARARKQKRNEKGALSLERAVHIFLQVLEGVGFAHKYRIIHGDIKPANILLDQQGRAKVSDFGLAFALPSGEKEGGKGFLGGTPHFMSPEQVLGESVDFRSDIYSLGVTFFLMVTGELPTGDRKKMMDLLEYHLDPSLEEAAGVLDGFEGIRPNIKKAILRALEKDPNNRHQSCLEFSLSIKQDATHEIYSELLRLSLLAKRQVTPAERAYLDKIARSKGLTPEEAETLEINIRNELGLPPLNLAEEYRLAYQDLILKGRHEKERYIDELKRTYVKKGRLTDSQAEMLVQEARAKIL